MAWKGSNDQSSELYSEKRKAPYIPIFSNAITSMARIYQGSYKNVLVYTVCWQATGYLRLRDECLKRLSLSRSLALQKGWASQNFQIFGTRKWQRFSALRTGRLYPQEIPLLLISASGWVDPKTIVQPDGLIQLKFPMTPTEIEPTTFWL